VSGVSDRASIHREWARNAGQYLGHIRTEAAFGGMRLGCFFAGLRDALGDATGDALRKGKGFSKTWKDVNR
jgi:hypothetical protein